MTDKVQKIRKEVERMHNLLPIMDGDNIYLNYADRICTTLEMYIDSLQEEPAHCTGIGDPKEESGVLGEMIKEMKEEPKDYCEEPVSDDLEKAAVNAFKQIVDSDKNNFLEIFKAGAKWQKTKDESTTEDLGEYINELSKQFPEVSFAKLSRIAVRMARWQKKQMMNEAVEQEIKVDAGGYPYISCNIEFYDYKNDKPLANKGDKVKVLVLKED